MSMAALRIGATDITPVIPQAGRVEQAVREATRRPSVPLRPQPFSLYASRREESITCRETATGAYEAILGNDPVLQEPSSRKGQIVDLWI
jgi:hypothetical protein